MKRYKINELVYKCYENDTLVEDPEGELVKVDDLIEVLISLSTNMEEELNKLDSKYTWIVTFKNFLNK